ncbi:hypothetical protein BW723_16550 [Polaribacter reichenbachii]|uniref:Secretion system C-terminal sorting domain-containing protein n=1 Tax=Polaribacter reichenbachii TaxID=996801 RepID=A0A1B8TRB7_9FLAO|nr:T9SS type A sorting domain-containing protein [Polaribacter reichenbachii]APZ47807.1 hypothetical protein BW723_16550 [Polaribacter reichenbachii]AUC18442.1 hypothetical protein BTO17_06970 [Polaribacter reichenbachii]OBY62207.1 hypothetical protein LPB301_15095 [Polaribacter reichenbachii]
MKTKIFYLVILASFNYFSANCQNLLDLSSWTVGSGSVLGYSQHGLTLENIRDYGKNHIGEEEIIWIASPDLNGGSSGGFYTDFFNIDNEKSYRFSIWLKKLNSKDGTTLLGTVSNNNTTLKLDGTIQNDPYFFIGDLPSLNRWYLLVGYIHSSTYNSTINYGAVYDGESGQKVQLLTDYKFKNNAINVRLQSYLHNDYNNLDRQFFYAPRMEELNGSELSIQELLGINNNSKLIVSYDMAGNQSQNFYCYDPNFCVAPAAKKEGKEVISEELLEEPIIDKELIENISVYPNPTTGFINIKLSTTLLSNIHSIKLYNVNSSLVKEIKTKKEIIDLDISRMANGVYFLHIHLKEGRSITKKIVKK